MSGCGGCPSNQNLQSVEPTEKNKNGEPLTVTEKAAGFIKGMMESQDRKKWGLKFEAVPGGCAGYKYFMGFKEKRDEDETEVESNGVKVFLATDSIDLIHGSEIDYVESLEATGLKVNNPNATSGCGCGKSFG
jgi:iron-sulfur cluster assembly accessory protein